MELDDPKMREGGTRFRKASHLEERMITTLEFKEAAPQLAATFIV
jgi:hypothetical protein